MATRAVGGQADQEAVVLGGMDACETAVAGITTAAITVAAGRACQGTIWVVASGAGVMHFRVIRVNGIANRRMAAGTIGRHGDKGRVIGGGMLGAKAAMAVVASVWPHIACRVTH